MMKHATIASALAIAAVSVVAQAQAVVELPTVEIEIKRTEIVEPTEDSANAVITRASSWTPSIAEVFIYGRAVQIRAIGTGKTQIEFFDSTTGNTYVVPVWVNASDKLAGGGYNTSKVQLPQVITQPGLTPKIVVPGSAPRINRIVSSNKSVATARTIAANLIEIDADALGDTFIDFTDVATGTNYQVHVWVTRNPVFIPPPVPGPVAGSGAGSGGGSGAGPGGGSGGGSGSGIKAGGFDTCLIGNWRSAAIVNKNNPGIGGGDGVILTFKANGAFAVDYSGMQPVTGPRGGVNGFSGKAGGTINASGGRAQITGVASSTVVWSIDGQNQISNGPGFWVPGTPVTNNSYSCTPTTLRFGNDKVEYRFSRQGNRR